jgi:transposase-like protein
MSKSRRAYAPEFRRQLVELLQGGRTPDVLAREFEPTAQSISLLPIDSCHVLRQNPIRS